MIVRLRFILYLLLILPSYLASAAVVEIDSGALRGIEEGGIHSFKGVPFAAPPIGQLRWAPPQAVATWQGERDASEHGAICVQTPFPEGSPFYRPLDKVSEDCLNLAVWSAELNPAQLRPVMVWIHGGSFTRGSGSEPEYDGALLARKGVVVVPSIIDSIFSATWRTQNSLRNKVAAQATMEFLIR